MLMAALDDIRRHVISDSTLEFLREAHHVPGYTLWDLAHGYFYARWPYLYIGVGTGEHPLARWLGLLAAWLSKVAGWIRPPAADASTFADTYHGKVLRPEAARQLVSIQEAVRLDQLEHVIPYRLARDIVMRYPQHIVVLDCPCRAGRADPCLPLDVCLIVGEPFAQFVLEHHRGRARAISGLEAQAILEAEHQRGHVHHAFFKDAMFGRFYAICNCCPCCCGAMQAMRNGTPMLASSGYLSILDEDRCQGCGNCAEICPFGALTVEDGRVAIDAHSCMGCGVCVDACPDGALALQRDAAQPEPLEIQELMARAAAQAADQP
jgi:ferredoxin